jgi:hypothetical protein
MNASGDRRLLASTGKRTRLKEFVLHGLALKGPVPLTLGAPAFLQPCHHHNSVNLVLPQHGPVVGWVGGVK